MKKSKRIVTFLLCFVMACFSISAPMVASAAISDAIEYGNETLSKWMTGFSFSEPLGGWTLSGWADALFASNKEQKYYTTPSESTEDKYGNVTNYYRGGDTTTTKIIDSYNKTFNTINNTTNNTNNYSANVKLSDFLNSYTTNNNNYTYSTQLKSWYYDNTQNTYNYDASQTYYNTDNRKYYVSIDNSTDEYYLIDVQYSPTFVTVNYTYNNIDNSVTNNYGDVTNVYYFELDDGRNSYSLTADEVAGLDLGYDVTNYQLVTDDPNTLSLQHFDGDYTDSSSYGNDLFSMNRSTTYVDSGAFGQALKLPSGSAAGVVIPGLSDYDGLTIDFRIYYSAISALGIYLGDTNLMQKIPSYKRAGYIDSYSDDDATFELGRFCTSHISSQYCIYKGYSELPSSVGTFDPTEYGYSFSNVLSSAHSAPTASSVGTWGTTYTSTYGWVSDVWTTPVKESSTTRAEAMGVEQDSSSYKYETVNYVNHISYLYSTRIIHELSTYYKAFPTSSIAANFSYSSYANQWVSMRITISGGKLYYFVNGDLVGSGDFTMPDADNFYIKSSGTLYLDELRITTGDMVSTGTYTPSAAPYDTNKVLALPTELTANTIYVRHSTPVSAWRIGGVRPSNPTTGFFYIPLYDDYTGAQGQLYDGSNWVDVDAVIYDGASTSSVIGFKFTPMGASTDVDVDLEPGRPAKPGEDADQSTCSHAWEETSRADATCTGVGSVTYTCSKCASTKTENLAKLNHTWEVKQSVQTTYDESGNVLTEGFTIYRCFVCGEEYKDTDGSGPPINNGSDSSDDGGNWFTKLLGKIGEFFGSAIGGLLELIGSVLTGLLDGLITLVTSALSKLTEITELFSSFGESIGALWSWLPSDIVTVLVAGVTVLIFAAVIKLFL